AGRVAYFPGDFDSTLWTVLDPDQGRVLANAARWALGEADVVSVSGPGVLDVCVWEGADALTVHVVNLTNPMMMKGPIREAYPVGPLEVEVRVPRGRTARE